MEGTGCGSAAPQTFPTKPTPAAFVSLFNLHILQKIMRGNRNQKFESHLGDTEPCPCCHQWPKVTSASHNIFAPPSLILKQISPVAKKSRSLPGRENHPAQGRGIWVDVSFQSPLLGHPVLSSHGFRVTSTRSRPSCVFPCGFPDHWLGERKAVKETGTQREQSSLWVFCCPRSPASAFQDPAGKEGGDHSFSRIIVRKFQPGGRG